MLNWSPKSPHISNLDTAFSKKASFKLPRSEHGLTTSPSFIRSRLQQYQQVTANVKFESFLDSAFTKNITEVDLKDEIVKYVQLIETSYS